MSLTKGAFNLSDVVQSKIDGRAKGYSASSLASTKGVFSKHSVIAAKFEAQPQEFHDAAIDSRSVNEGVAQSKKEGVPLPIVAV